MPKKGQVNATTKVAATVKGPKSAKKDGHAKSTTGVRKSSQAVRQGAKPAKRVQSKPVSRHSDADAVVRAEASATAARNANSAMIKEFAEAHRLTVADWLAVTSFVVFLILCGFAMGRLTS